MIETLQHAHLITQLTALPHTLGAYLHDLDPYMIRLFGDFGLRWYGLSYVAGFIVAFMLVRWLAAKRISPLQPQQAGDLVLAVALGTVIGGRVGYCVFYDPHLLIDFSAGFPFWGVLALNRGGMASHGGILGIIIACIYFGKRNHISTLHLFDLAAWTGMIGIFFGRLANFINGELYGRPCDESFALAVKFPQELREWVFQPDKLAPLEPAAEAIGISPIEWRNAVTMIGTDSSASAWIRTAINDMIIATQNGNTQLNEALQLVLTPRHPSQLYQAFGEGLLMFIAIGLIWMRPRKPGILGAWFMVLYAVARVIGEQFRMPDAHIGYQALGLTRGQWLSFAMFAVGMVLVTLWSRQKAPLIGGLLPSKRIESATNTGKA